MGTIELLRICAVAWPVGFAIMPFLILVKKSAPSAVFWTSAIVMMMLTSGVHMAFSEYFARDVLVSV